jgi:hypothetical protein
MSTENPMSLSASSSLRARLENAARVLNEMDALAVGNCALADLLREASAALDAYQEEEKAKSEVAGGSTVPITEPEATPILRERPQVITDLLACDATGTVANYIRALEAQPGIDVALRIVEVWADEYDEGDVSVQDLIDRLNVRRHAKA